MILQGFYIDGLLFESLIPCQKRETCNPLRLQVFLCISRVFGVFGIAES